MVPRRRPSIPRRVVGSISSLRRGSSLKGEDMKMEEKESSTLPQGMRELEKELSSLPRSERKYLLSHAFKKANVGAQARAPESSDAAIGEKYLHILRIRKDGYDQTRMSEHGTSLFHTKLEDVYGLDHHVRENLLLHCSNDVMSPNPIVVVYTSVVKTFFTFLGLLFDTYVITSTILGLLSVVFCVEMNITADLNFSLFTLPLVFPLTMAITSSYQNKMKFLTDMATFKANIVTYYFIHREIVNDTGLGVIFMEHNLFLLRAITTCTIRYLHNKNGEGRPALVAAIYNLFANLAESNDILRRSSESQLSIYLRLTQNLVGLVESVEKVRCAQDYKTPRTLRCYTKVCRETFTSPPKRVAEDNEVLGHHDTKMHSAYSRASQMFVFATPFLMGPLFGYVVTKFGYAAGLYGAGLTTFIFSTLQRIQDGMDDFFDGDSVDDVDLDELGQWFDSCISDVLLTEAHHTKKSHRTRGAPRALQPAFNVALDLGNSLAKRPLSPRLGLGSPRTPRSSKCSMLSGTQDFSRARSSESASHPRRSLKRLSPIRPAEYARKSLD